MQIGRSTASLTRSNSRTTSRSFSGVYDIADSRMASAPAVCASRACSSTWSVRSALTPAITGLLRASRAVLIARRRWARFRYAAAPVLPRTPTESTAEFSRRSRSVPNSSTMMSPDADAGVSGNALKPVKSADLSAIGFSCFPACILGFHSTPGTPPSGWVGCGGNRTDPVDAARGIRIADHAQRSRLGHAETFSSRTWASAPANTCGSCAPEMPYLPSMTKKGTPWMP